MSKYYTDVNIDNACFYIGKKFANDDEHDAYYDKIKSDPEARKQFLIEQYCILMSKLQNSYVYYDIVDVDDTNR